MSSAVNLPNRDQWSVRADGSKHAATGTEKVVVVPDDGDVASGFAKVRELLQATEPGTVIRLIGPNVTDLHRCPEWLRAHSLSQHVILTEVDAYLPLERSARLAQFGTWVDAWLDDVLGTAFDGVDVARAFRSTFSNRVVLQSLAALVLLDGVRFHHAQDVVCTSDARFAKYLGGASPASRRERFWFGLKLVALTSLNTVAALVLRAKEFLSESTSRRALNALKTSHAHPVTSWVGVIGSWPYASRHVIECIKGDEVTGAFGVMLEDTLRGGVQHAHHGETSIANDVFPTLEHPAIRDRYGAIGQCVSAVSCSELLRVFLVSLSVTFRACWRAVRWGPTLEGLHLEDGVGGLARALSIDVLRATESAVATKRLTHEHSFRGVTVVLPHASAPSTAVADLLLQREGATTVELVHGAFADRQGVVTYAFSASTVRATWTEVEARMLEPSCRGQRCIGGFVPRGPAVQRVARPKVETILALTNYGIGVVGPPAGSHLRLAYCQRVFFDALAFAVNATGRRFTVRWRPHPADDKQTFQSVLRDHSSLKLEVSQGTHTLEEDLEVADIVISSWSSALVEALRHPVPIFVHSIPYYECDGTLAAFAPERRFSTRDELTKPFADAIAAIERNDVTALEHERMLRKAFFGPTEQARPAHLLLSVKGLAQ